MLAEFDAHHAFGFFAADHDPLRARAVLDELPVHLMPADRALTGLPKAEMQLRLPPELQSSAKAELAIPNAPNVSADATNGVIVDLSPMSLRPA